MGELFDLLLVQLAKAGAAIQAQVQAARERDLARVKTEAAAVEAREAKRRETDP